jgi:predicted RNase H-like HicB family nuclease
MEIPVLLQPLENMRFRASAVEPLAMSAEGQTREEALENLKKRIQEQIAQGAELVFLNIPLPRCTFPTTKPAWPDDEITQWWLEGIEEYRRQANSTPDPWDTEAE